MPAMVSTAPLAPLSGLVFHESGPNTIVECFYSLDGLPGKNYGNGSELNFGEWPFEQLMDSKQTLHRREQFGDGCLLSLE